MKKNVGSNDALTRLVIAMIFLALWGFKIVTGVFAIVLLVVGGIFVLTAISERCPIYGIMGISSCNTEEN